MTPEDAPTPPPPDSHDLENAFFHPEDERLVAKLREIKQMVDSRQALSEVSGIRDHRILDKLLALKVRPEIAAALAVVPLIEVAWADGKVDPKEREAVLARLVEAGVARGGIEHEIVESWLGRRPKPALIKAWEHYVQGLCRSMTEAEREAFRDELFKGVKAVAEASGGFAGIRRISPSEQDAIAKLKMSFLAAR